MACADNLKFSINIVGKISEAILSCLCNECAVHVQTSLLCTGSGCQAGSTVSDRHDDQSCGRPDDILPVVALPSFAIYGLLLMDPTLQASDYLSY